MLNAINAVLSASASQVSVTVVMTFHRGRGEVVGNAISQT